MIPRDAFINKLRELKYSYKDQTDKVLAYRRNGSTHMVFIPRKENPLSETYVRSTLHQCGCTDDQIEKFISATRRH